MARDRPSPYGEGQAFFIVARGPVPRERWSARARTMTRETRSQARVAGEGPHPTMKGDFCGVKTTGLFPEFHQRDLKARPAASIYQAYPEFR